MPSFLRGFVLAERIGPTTSITRPYPSIKRRLWTSFWAPLMDSAGGRINPTRMKVKENDEYVRRAARAEKSSANFTEHYSLPSFYRRTRSRQRDSPTVSYARRESRM